MSRFDLFFVIFDKKDDEEDKAIATHIVNMHMLKDDKSKQKFTKEQLQTFIKITR